MIVSKYLMQRTTTPLFKVINWGKVIHTGSKSSCDVYISKRVIVDISCIDLLVSNEVELKIDTHTGSQN